MNDSELYTGVDSPEAGIFGNEIENEEVKRLKEDQDRKLKEITPKIEAIIDLIDAERAVALQFISEYVDSNKDTDAVFRAEIKATARYRRYLDELKTKFILALNEAKK